MLGHTCFKGSSWNRVGDSRPLGLRRPLFSRGGTPFRRAGELVTMSGWANSDDFRISIGSPASSPWLECGGSSVTLGPWSSRSAGAEKNPLRSLRGRASRLLRSTAAPRARPLLRRPPSLSRALGSPGRLLSVRWREARAARLAGAGSPRGIAPPGLPQIRTCTFVHTARQVMSSLRDGTRSESRSAAGAGSAPETE